MSGLPLGSFSPSELTVYRRSDVFLKPNAGPFLAVGYSGATCPDGWR